MLLAPGPLWHQWNCSVHFRSSASGLSLCGERARVAQSPPPWQPRLPAKKIAASRCPQLIPCGYRVGRDPASMQVAPSRRFPAPRPGLQETLRRFSAGLTLPPALQPSECGTGMGPRRQRAGRCAQCEAPISWRGAGIDKGAAQPPCHVHRLRRHYILLNIR